MKTCYHFTNKAQLGQIFSEWLKPKYGINSQLISDSREEKVEKFKNIALSIKIQKGHDNNIPYIKRRTIY